MRDIDKLTDKNFSSELLHAIAADEIRFKAKFKARILPEFSAWQKSLVD